MPLPGPRPTRNEAVTVGPSFLMVLDESFDIGPDTRTLVDDSYKLAFRFTGTIDKLTYKIGHEQIAAEDRERIKRALATVHD
jgi:hypothetical protein